MTRGFGDLGVHRGRQTIALCMIVRNESLVLERCLRSLEGMIDSWVICDTGSTDGTAALARALLGHLPGDLHERPWRDFGHNRSELLELAAGRADYLLLLDADMTVEQRAPLPELSADAYLLRETGGLDFGVIRLVRGDRRWWYEGSTHEYIATDGELVQEELPELEIVHHADGSSRPQKLLRDAGLLKRDILERPESPRPVFYLAQTYRDMGRADLAAGYYRRRVRMGGWEEEVFYSLLQEGTLRCKESLAAGVPILLEAWQRRPTRAEPLFELAQTYRQNGDFTLARLFAERGLQIAYPGDVLFVHRWVYDYGLLLERALACGGLGDTEQAKADLSTILEFADLPAEVRRYIEECRLSMTRESPPMPEEPPAGRDTPRFHTRARIDPESGPVRLASLLPGVSVGEIKVDVKPAWPCFNPSIAADGDGFRMILRTANYAIERGVLHAEGVLHNINYMLTLDSSLAVTQIDPLVDRSERPRSEGTRIVGYEDCRLVRVAGSWYATATVCDMNPADRREIALLSFDGADITRVRALKGPNPGRHEKNWMPLVIDGELNILYSASPTIVMRCDVESGALEKVVQSEAPAAAGLRGGSQGLAVAGGYLFVVHETRREGRALRYLHRFILLDEELTLTRISPQFTFTGDLVEFCAGMAMRASEVVLSFGVSDAAAGLAVLPLDGVLGLLEPVDLPASVS